MRIFGVTHTFACTIGITLRWPIWIPLLSALLALAVASAEAEGVEPSTTTAATQPAVSDLPVRPTKFTFTIANYRFLVDENGKGSRVRPGGRPQSFLLTVNDGDIERIQYLEFRNFVVVIYELNDGESGWAHVVALDNQTLKRKWLARVPTFNIGQGILDAPYLYLSGTGFVAKLDLKSGRYVWKHDRLYIPGFWNSKGQYEVGYFNSFLPPRLERNIVVFPEADPGSHTDRRYAAPPRPPVMLKVDKDSGKLLTQLPERKLP